MKTVTQFFRIIIRTNKDTNNIRNWNCRLWNKRGAQCRYLQNQIMGMEEGGGLEKKNIRPNRKNILMYMKKDFYLFGS